MFATFVEDKKIAENPAKSTFAQFVASIVCKYLDANKTPKYNIVCSARILLRIHAPNVR